MSFLNLDWLIPNFIPKILELIAICKTLYDYINYMDKWKVKAYKRNSITRESIQHKDAALAAYYFPL